MKNANPVSLRFGAAGALLVAALVAGCGSDKPAAGASTPKTVFEHFTVNVAGHPSSLQIAVTQMEQERGLMQRPDLGPDEGMLFVYPEPQAMSIWMRNTPEPLDLAYLTPDGVVVEMYGLLPLDERPVNSHSDTMQFALELPRGWFASHGVKAGDRIDLKAVAGALKARGFDPAKFHLPAESP